MKKTLSSILLEYLKNEYQDIAVIYYHLFSIQPKNLLDEILSVYYEESKKDEYWFPAFHKAIRQTDFFNNCYVNVPTPTITDEEKKELETLNKEFYLVQKEVRAFEQQLLENLPESTHPSYEEKNKEYINAYQAKKLELSPNEKFQRRNELRKKEHNEEQESIDGRLDSILWAVISMDEKGFLYFILERTFNEYDFLKKHNKL